MAGFLDMQERIVDLILTAEGRRLLSTGRFELVYYSFFDDEVDYGPYISNSGSLSSVQLSSSVDEQLEATLVREASAGLMFGHDRSARDTTNVNRPLFTMPQGQTFLSRLSVDPDVMSGSIQVKQRSLLETHTRQDTAGRVVERLGPFNRGSERFDPTTFYLDVGVDDFFDAARQDGCLVKVFRSGSDGLDEVGSRLDLQGDISFWNDLRMFIDLAARRIGGGQQ